MLWIMVIYRMVVLVVDALMAWNSVLVFCCMYSLVVWLVVPVLSFVVVSFMVAHVVVVVRVPLGRILVILLVTHVLQRVRQVVCRLVQRVVMAHPVVTVLVAGYMRVSMDILVPMMVVPMMLIGVNKPMVRRLVVAVFTDMVVSASVVLIKMLLRSRSSVVAYLMVSDGVSRAVLHIMHPRVF